MIFSNIFLLKVHIHTSTDAAEQKGSLPLLKKKNYFYSWMQN